MQSTTINAPSTDRHNPLPDILQFLLTLTMSKASDLGRDEVREASRRAWLALSTYMKQEALAQIEESEPEEVEQTPQRANGVSKTISRSIRERFQPRTHRVA
jgi:hypothetical protein